jgi:hypothetical protein
MPPEATKQVRSPSILGIYQEEESSPATIVHGITLTKDMTTKTENAAPTTIAGGFKATVAPLVINGVRQLIVSVVACGLPMGSFPQYQKNKACEFIQINNPKPVPRNKWYHLEVFYKAAAPSVLGNQDIKQPGEIIVWQDGVEVFNISHPNFDTLRSDRKSGTLSDNKYMYWGIGNYICTCSQPPLNVLYTDDAMVTDYPVHLELFGGPIDSVPPSAPTGLTIFP